VEQDDQSRPGLKIEVEAMFYTWCELSNKNKSAKCGVLFTPDVKKFRNQDWLLDSHASSQYCQQANCSLLATQKASKVAFNKSLLSKSKDLDLVNKFSIVFTMVKERIPLRSFHNMRSAAALFAVQTVQAQPPENG